MVSGLENSNRNRSDSFSLSLSLAECRSGIWKGIPTSYHTLLRYPYYLSDIGCRRGEEEGRESVETAFPGIYIYMMEFDRGTRHVLSFVMMMEKKKKKKKMMMMMNSISSSEAMLSNAF